MKCSCLYFLLLRKDMLAVYFPQPPLQFKSHNSLRLKGGCDKSSSIRQFWRGNSWQWKIKRLYKTTTTMMMMMMSRRGTIALQVSLGGHTTSPPLRLLLLRPAQGTRSDFVGIHHRLGSSWSAGSLWAYSSGWWWCSWEPCWWCWSVLTMIRMTELASYFA